MKKVWKNVSFIIGFLFLFGLLGGSILYDWIFHNQIPEASLRFEGETVQSPPYAPWEYPPFGTNAMAESLFHILLIGAKYTLGVAFLIAFLRFVFSSVIGTFAEMYSPKWTEKVRPSLEAFYYFPITLIAFLTLEWVLFRDGFFDGVNSEFTFGFSERVIIEVVVLTVVAVPITSLTIANEVKQIRQKEFMESVRILGGSRFHILKKHVLPILKPQLVIIFLREVIQVLILLAHLGILGIFFGGGAMQTDLFDNSVFVSLSNEWSGLIGNNIKYLFTSYWWIAFVPILMLTLSVLALKLMVEGYQSAQKQVTTKREEKKEKRSTLENPFERVSND